MPSFARFLPILVGVVVAIALLFPTLVMSGQRSDEATLSDVGAMPTPAGVMGVASRAMRQTQVTPAPTVCPAPTHLQGVDVSWWQGTVDWVQVAQSGRAFAYARATDGETYSDPQFQTNYAGIKAAGMKAGAYLFFEPDQDPTAQANLLVSALQQAHFAPGDLLPVFDVEVTGGQPGPTIAANLHVAIDAVQHSLRVTPMIYTAWSWWNSYVGASTFGANLLWTANWNVSCPGVPMGWSTWTLWQYTANSSVPGIIGESDSDESNGPSLPVSIPLTSTVHLPLLFK